MGQHNEYFVVPRADGTYAVELPHAEWASAIVNTEKQGIAKAQQFSPEGVVHVKKPNGQFRHVQPKR